MKKLTVGILAHVDAGKTTLSESLLYYSGMIRQLGRVDRGNAFLDTNHLEKARGITIFSKQAVIRTDDMTIYLLDTPGHVDFSAEMERTLQVLDYAILVVSGPDGVQGHTQTLWRLLARYRVPVFLFVNKMDLAGKEQQAPLMTQLKAKLSDACTDFTDTTSDEFLESAAVCEEELLDHFLETGEVEDEDIIRLIASRKLFPCYFGQALVRTEKILTAKAAETEAKNNRVPAFIEGFSHYTREPARPEAFGAKVFKVSRDDQGARLTWLKVTGGSLKVRTILNQDMVSGAADGEEWEEKINQIRVYSGVKYTTANEAEAGTVCAVMGLTHTHPGQGIGAEAASEAPVLEPVLTYKVVLPFGMDPNQMLPKLRELEEEVPELSIVWDEEVREIQAQIMGEVQIEILRSLIRERFGVEVEFGAGKILYRETIRNTVEGVGHFEPLRHYAEVHLMLEPGEPGSGLKFDTDCSEDILNKNWQRLVLTHLEEKQHKGVLTGSPITDMKITLVSGRAHVKHTEGGDFRQATYRAVRQGLMQADSVLLEPWYDYRLEIPSDLVGRAMADIDRRGGTMNPPELEGDLSVITGSGPVVNFRDYQAEVTAYARGRGSFTCTVKGYLPCHNTEEVVLARGYDPDRDLANPTGSVFCTHGAGFRVPWDEVPDYMHLEFRNGRSKEEMTLLSGPASDREEERFIGTDEIDAIIAKTFYANGRDKSLERKGIGRREYGTKPTAAPVTRTWKKPEKKDEYLLVDGYNIIFSWPELKALSSDNVDAARTTLMDTMCNYQGYRQCQIIVVFDAYRVQGHQTEYGDYHNIHVVYTAEAETADQYIEKFAHTNASKFRVIVATSDGLEQVIIRGAGCELMSSKDLLAEVKNSAKVLSEHFEDRSGQRRNYLLDAVSPEVAEQLKKIGREDPDAPKT